MSFSCRLQPLVVDLYQLRFKVILRLYKDGNVWAVLKDNPETKICIPLEQGHPTQGPQLRIPSLVSDADRERQKRIVRDYLSARAKVARAHYEASGAESWRHEFELFQSAQADKNLTARAISDWWSKLNGQNLDKVRVADKRISRLVAGLLSNHVEGSKVIQDLKLGDEIDLSNWKITPRHLGGYHFQLKSGENMTSDDFLEDVFEQLS